MNSKRNLYWRISCGAAILLTILAYSPVVIPMGKSTPEFMGMPYTLWMGLLMSFVFLGVTYLGILFHPAKEE